MLRCILCETSEAKVEILVRDVQKSPDRVRALSPKGYSLVASVAFWLRLSHDRSDTNFALDRSPVLARLN
jgi:hypothetical protein